MNKPRKSYADLHYEASCCIQLGCTWGHSAIWDPVRHSVVFQRTGPLWFNKEPIILELGDFEFCDILYIDIHKGPKGLKPITGTRDFVTFEEHSLVIKHA